MMHPVINQIGVDTQNEVVKEEKDCVWQQSLWTNHSWVKKRYSQITLIAGRLLAMDHLDAATLTEFQDFNKKFYIPITPFL
jgi:predicted Zn-dependent peptidase